MKDEDKDLYGLGLCIMAIMFGIVIPIATFISIIYIAISLGDAIMALTLQ